jgi:hypothetical protein
MQRHLPQTVTTSILMLVYAGGGEAELDGEFRYDPSDPLAVGLAIGVGYSDPVVWTFARDLLQAGVAGPSGMGDITIEPAAPRPGRPMLRITLATDCLATMLVDRDAVVEFLLESYTLVPSGAEITEADLDAEIAALLG